ncbi:DUF4214 domain-containing protein [Marivita sp. GX14005]|uniref:DUF4214 domain-containing protein n=1 Tax=Marivita sp. GX14005 TaxID=2942276 RepID=UPI00201A15C6|nr:DUF4214 domain-containing protein [Marivita sp. GX14005]MCL3881468.1 DUF4214 domain-containing protein [Marivita sp. GX14005]
MAVKLTLVRDGDEAELVVTATEASETGLEFSFDSKILAEGAALEDLDLGESGSFSTNSTRVDDVIETTVSGRLSVPVAVGDEILSYEFDLLSDGRIEVQEFTGSTGGVDFDQPELAMLDFAGPTADLIDGTFAVGNDLTVNFSKLPDADDSDDITFDVQWLRDGAEIDGATGNTYTLTDDDLGAEISVQVSYTDDDQDNRVVKSADNETVTIAGETIEGTAGDDDLVGTEGADIIRGLAGDDRIEGKAGSDLIDGGDGFDTSVHSGPQNSYTLAVAEDGITLTDRRDDGDGTDGLVAIEALDFSDSDAPFNIEQLTGGAGIDDDALEDIIELYIGYFNRAPDAVGLNFWATAYQNGTTLKEMASLFEEQSEFDDRYVDDISTTDFVEQIYFNVLGRNADADGLDFWTGVLDDGAIGRDTFVYELLEGVDADAPDGASDAFKDQKEQDEDYLDAKTDLGALYAATLGLTDVSEAQQALAGFNGSASSIADSVSTINGFFADATDAESGDFLMPLVGVVDTDYLV